MARALRTTLASFQSAIPWSPVILDRGKYTSAHQIKLPDLLGALPDAARDFRINSLCKDISEASDQWAEDTIGLCPSRVRKSGIARTSRASSDERTLKASSAVENDSESDKLDLKTGLLASMCFPATDRTQLKLCADFFAWISLLDYSMANRSLEEAVECIEEVTRLAENEPACTEINDPGFSRGLQEIMKRVEQSPESPFMYDRFRQAIICSLKLLQGQLLLVSASHLSPRFKENVARRREAGWHAPLFVLIEYAHGLESVSMDRRWKSTIKSARDSAAEIFVYAADIYECAGVFGCTSRFRSRFPNCIELFCQERRIGIPQALDRIGGLSARQLRAFNAIEVGLRVQNRKDSIQRDLQTYVRGIGDCIRGILHWAFESDRFFGSEGAYVQLTLTVEARSTETTPEEADEL